MQVFFRSGASTTLFRPRALPAHPSQFSRPPPLQCDGRNPCGGGILQTRVRKLTVHTRRAFAIARSSDDTFERVVLEIQEDGFTGRGEAAPSGRYDQDAEGGAATLGDGGGGGRGGRG